MKQSEKGKQHLIIVEGCKLEAYQDVRGIWTIAFGFTEINGKPVKKGDTITLEEAKKLLPEVLAPYENCVTKALARDPYQYEFDALLSFTYNIGQAGFQQSQVLKDFNAGRKDLAAIHMFNWRRPVEILGRRMKDAELMLTGVYCV